MSSSTGLSPSWSNESHSNPSVFPCGRGFLQNCPFLYLFVLSDWQFLGIFGDVAWSAPVLLPAVIPILHLELCPALLWPNTLWRFDPETHQWFSVFMTFHDTGMYGLWSSCCAKKTWNPVRYTQWSHWTQSRRMYRPDLRGAFFLGSCPATTWCKTLNIAMAHLVRWFPNVVITILYKWPEGRLSSKLWTGCGWRGEIYIYI